MKLLTIFDTLYQSHIFTTSLLVVIILLVFFFFLLFFLGLQDAKKGKKKDTLEQEKKSKEPVHFINRKEKKEDVTFEESFLTQNLENFKKTLEEEIKREDECLELKPDAKDYVEIIEEKKTPILDKELIEDTVMSPILIDEETDLEIPKSKKSA